MLQVVELLPELSATSMRLCENLQAWHEMYQAELDAAAGRSAADKDVEKV